MTDQRPSIAELQRVEREMTPGEWWASDEEGSVYAGEPPRSVDVGEVDWSCEDQYGAITLRNAAPVLLEIAATGMAWAAAEDALQSAPPGVARILAASRATEAFDKHRDALAKVRP